MVSFDLAAISCFITLRTMAASFKNMSTRRCSVVVVPKGCSSFVFMTHVNTLILCRIDICVFLCHYNN